MTDTQKRALIGILIAALVAAAAVFGINIPVLPGV